MMTIQLTQREILFLTSLIQFFYSLEELDLCFVALREVDGFPKLKTFGWLPLLQDEGKILIGDPVNIVQHPRGQQKRLVVHNSTFVLVTDKGSSGAPVMNARWEVVALHHKAIPAVDKNGHVLDIDGKMIAESRIGDADTRVKWIANEGVRVSRIVANFEAADFANPQKEIRDTLLALWNDPMATMLARRASFNGMNDA